MFSTTYDNNFFDAQQSGSLRSAQEMVPAIIELLNPQSVIDVGCGVGTWLSVFAEHGVKDVWGVDGNYIDKNSFQVSFDRFIPMDLSNPSDVDRNFDLVISLEVAEHLPSENVDKFVDLLTSLGPVVIFSAAIPFQSGHNHVNEQWQDFWVIEFAKRGFSAFDYLRTKFWRNENIKYWYLQNSLIYIEQNYLQQNLPVKHALGSDSFPISIVHPRQFECFADPNIIDLRKIGLKKTLMALPQLFWNSIYGRVKQQ